jgi:hypothetical protein
MDLLRKAFRDIAAGCTVAKVIDRPCFIKHLSYADQIGVEDKRDEFMREAKEAGLPTNEEKMALLRKQGLWTQQQDVELAQIKQSIPDLIEAKRKNANMPSLVTLYVNQIAQAEKDYEAKEMARRRLLELTCESFAERCVNDYYIVINLFKDKELQNPLFTDAEFDWFRDEMVSAIVKDYNEATESCSDRNLKKLAMQPFFQRFFQLAGENLTSMFGRPIYAMTDHQVNLLRYGMLFRSIYQNHDLNTFPPAALEDPDLMIDHASAITKGKQDMAAKGADDPNTTVMGLKSEDRKALGVKPNPKAMQEMFKLGR